MLSMLFFVLGYYYYPTPYSPTPNPQDDAFVTKGIIAIVIPFSIIFIAIVVAVIIKCMRKVKKSHEESSSMSSSSSVSSTVYMEKADPCMPLPNQYPMGPGVPGQTIVITGASHSSRHKPFKSTFHNSHFGNRAGFHHSAAGHRTGISHSTAGHRTGFSHSSARRPGGVSRGRH